jgi:hypothetical protein
MRQTTTAEVRLDEGKAKSCSTMRPTPDRLGRSQPPSWAELLPERKKPRLCRSFEPPSGEFRLKPGGNPLRGLP